MDQARPQVEGPEVRMRFGYRPKEPPRGACNGQNFESPPHRPWTGSDPRAGAQNHDDEHGILDFSPVSGDLHSVDQVVDPLSIFQDCYDVSQGVAMHEHVVDLSSISGEALDVVEGVTTYSHVRDVDHDGRQDAHVREMQQHPFHKFHQARRQLEQHSGNPTDFDRYGQKSAVNRQPSISRFLSGPRADGAGGWESPPATLGLYPPDGFSDDLAARFENTIPVEDRLPPITSSDYGGVTLGRPSPDSEEDDNVLSIVPGLPLPSAHHVSPFSLHSPEEVFVGSAQVVQLNRAGNAVCIEINSGKSALPTECGLGKALDEAVSLEENIDSRLPTKGLEDGMILQHPKVVFATQESNLSSKEQGRTGIPEVYYTHHNKSPTIDAVKNILTSEELDQYWGFLNTFHDVRSEPSLGQLAPLPGGFSEACNPPPPRYNVIDVLPPVAEDGTAWSQELSLSPPPSSSLSRPGRRTEAAQAVPFHFWPQVEGYLDPARGGRLAVQNAGNESEIPGQQDEWTLDPCGKLWKPLPLN